MSITHLTHLWIQLLLRGVLRQQTEICEPEKGANQKSYCGVLEVLHVFRSTTKRDINDWNCTFAWQLSVPSQSGMPWAAEI